MALPMLAQAFHPSPPEDRPPVLGDQHARGRYLLWASCLCAIGLAYLPWSEVRFSSLWGTAAGSRGFDTTEGVITAMAAAMTLVLSLIEGRSRTAQEATAPGIRFVLGFAIALMLWRWWQGAPGVRGVTGAHSWAFYGALLCCLTAGTVVLLRTAGVGTRRGLR